MPDGMDHLRHPPSHRNCRCTFVERFPLGAGDFVRYNGGGIGQITESRMSANGEHTLRIEGIRGLDVAECHLLELLPDPRLEDSIPNLGLRAQVESLQGRIRVAEAAEGIGASTSRPALEAEANVLLERIREQVQTGERFILDSVGRIIADDPTDDGALPGETTEERVTRQREASARWVQRIRSNDHRDEVEGREQFGPALEFTREGVEEWGRRQGDEITVEQELNRDHIDVIAHRDDFESVSRVSMFALHRARDPFLMLRVAAEAALRAVGGMSEALGQAAEAAEQFRTVAQTISVNMLDAEGAAQRLRDAAADLGLSAGEAVGNMGNMTRAMRQWEAQYTNRPGVFTGLTEEGEGNVSGPVITEHRSDAEYGEDAHDFEDEQSW